MTVRFFFCRGLALITISTERNTLSGPSSFLFFFPSCFCQIKCNEATVLMRGALWRATTSRASGSNRNSFILWRLSGNNTAPLRLQLFSVIFFVWVLFSCHISVFIKQLCTFLTHSFFAEVISNLTPAKNQDRLWLSLRTAFQSLTT